MDKIFEGLPEIFYDLIAIFIPGFYLYFCLALMYGQNILSDLKLFSPINDTVTNLVLIYISGFVVYYLSSYFIAKSFTYLFGDPKFALLGGIILERHKFCNRFFIGESSHDMISYYKSNVEKKLKKIHEDENFVLNENNIHAIFEYCRNYVMENRKQWTNIRKEQAYGEMSRGLLLVSVVCIIWLFIITIFFGKIVTNYWYILVFYLFSAGAFAYRYGQARNINPIFIYSRFIINLELKEDEKK